MAVTRRSRALWGDLSGLSADHIERLEWFEERAGQEIGWPGQLDEERFLCSLTGGIFKPKGWEYALSVRQSIEPIYPDMEPVLEADGSWGYQYHQEEQAGKTDTFRNKALMRCMADRVPVAVFRKISDSPARYEVLGLARVDYFDGKYFHFQGYSSEGELSKNGFEEYMEKQGGSSPSKGGVPIDVVLESEIEDYDFNPKSMKDGRKKILASITRREGGAKFRGELLSAYSKRCAMTGCVEESALQAAHIKPYMGPETNHVQNGLLLRSDVHVLFDRLKVAIDTESWEWIVHPDVSDQYYRDLDGGVVGLPDDERLWPSKMALDEHRHLCGF